MKRLRSVFSPAAALFAALGIITAITAGLSDTPGRAMLWILTGPVRNSLVLGDFLASASRLTLAGTAAALAFRAGFFNLGGEGQALAGGLAAAAAAILLPNPSKFMAVSLAVAAAVAAGALIGGFSGFLKARRNIDEMISTFLVSAAVLPIEAVLLGGPMKDADSYLIAAPPLPDAYGLKSWLPPSRLGSAAIWAVLIAAAAYLFFTYSRIGYEWRLCGKSKQFARYGGLRTGVIATASLAASGGLFGLAGAAALMDGGQAVQGFTGGLGWNGLAVALIAASRPEFVPLAALAYAWLYAGTQAAMTHSGFSYSLSGLVQAVVFLLVTARFGFGLIREKRRKKACGPGKRM